MVTLDKKKEIVAGLKDKFQRATGFYLVDFSGITVEGSIRLRREFKKLGIDYKVAKNTLIHRALSEIGDVVVPDEKFTGTTGVVFGYDDAIAPARIIKEQFDKFELPKLKAAVIEGQFFDGTKLKEIAALPSKNDLIAGILGSLDAPISGIIGSINAVMRDLASVIEEAAKKKAA